jgi:aspartate/methionine/tyrosine aminotransferase
VRLIADEIYEDLMFGPPHVSAAERGEDVVYVSGVSKTYAMTGWRLGWAIAPEHVVSAMEKLQEPLLSCASSVSQAAAEAALRGPQDCVDDMRAAYARRREAVIAALEPAGLLPVLPRGGFFALADLRGTGLAGLGLARTVLEEARVATVPGAAFGSSIDAMVRVSFAAADEHVIEGCARLLDFHARRAHQPSATPSLRGSDPAA